MSQSCCHPPKEAPLAPVIRARGVKVRLGGNEILRGVNLDVPAGELVALIGPNGSGKTTFLRAVLGLQRLSAGEIQLFGSGDRQAALQRVGYVPQRMNLERSFILSVREFLALRLRATRHWFFHSKKRTDEQIEASLEEMGIRPLLERPLAALSGGQLQRVLIAFSLLTNPDLLLLDEPTAGVDVQGEESFYDLIAGVQRRHRISAVLVSHDLSMVYRHASWVYALNGVVCCEGPPETVMNADSLKQAYGIHVSPYHHHHHGHAH
jgi:ABC-type Mn2+/Zn2+ transport system ATPase subunit